MMVNTVSFRLASAILLSALVLSSPNANAVELSKAVDGHADHEVVELFAARDRGDIDVQFIPKDARAGKVLIKNNTDMPVAVRLPEAFAGVPVLAQFGGGIGGLGGGGGGIGGGGGGIGGGQGLGGGFGGGGFGGGGLGGGGFGGGGLGGAGVGGLFNVAPGKVRKIKVDLVCLEHGKKDPTPRTKYKLVAIDSFTKDPRVIALCSMLGRGEIPQNAAQAAAWHLASGLNWNQLAAKNRVETRFQTIRYFNGADLMLARRIIAEANRRAHRYEVAQDTSLADR